MTASLKIKSGYYYAVINYKDGSTYKQKWISLKLPIKNNKRKAEAMLEDIKSKYIVDGNQTLELPRKHSDEELFVNYVGKWLLQKKPFVELSTWEGYQTYAERHIIPYFEPLKLYVKDVKPQHIKEYYEYKYTKGRLDHKDGGLSIPSLKKHSIVLKEVLDEAVMEEIVPRNPALGVKMPGKNNGSIDRVFLTAREANVLLRAFEGHPLKALVYVTLYYGLRRSEVLGLRWSAIDFENNLITINHTIVKNKTIVAKDSTKTESSNHTYQLIDDVKKVLLERKEEQERARKQFGDGCVKNDYVFTWEDGSLFRPDYVTRGFQRVLKRNSLRMMRFHDLRHSTSSILYDKGWSIKDIQVWLRHSSIEVTSDIYTHISEDRKASMAKELNSTFKFDE